VLVLGALAVAYALGVFGPKGVPVPNVTGMTPSEAQTAITDAGLVVGDVEQQYSDEATPGVVMDQSPEPGVEAEKGSSVKLVVSKGKELLTVPDLKGKTESEASRLAREAGFALDVPERVPSKDIPKGIVIAQSPEAGTEQAKGTLIVLTISEGPELKQVPDILGKSKADAQAAIEAAGLAPKFTEDFSDTVAPGKVISQTPDPGVFVNAGATVTGVISKGPATVTVPDVTDKSEADAKATLEGLGLKVTVNYQISPDVGFVLTQDPLPNAVVQKGSNVTIWVGKSSS
jgi:serine/threonine-protein kinase